MRRQDQKLADCCLHGLIFFQKNPKGLFSNDVPNVKIMANFINFGLKMLIYPTLHEATFERISIHVLVVTEVTVVVDINVHYTLSVITDPGQGLDHEPLLLETGTRRLENVEENLLEEYLYLGLKVGLEFHQQRQEYREGEFKHFTDVRDTVL